MIIANCKKANTFFEHLRSSQISEQYLIFVVLVGHLIIPNEIGIKTYLNMPSQQLEYEVSFSEKKTSYKTYPEAVLYSNADNSQSIWTKKTFCSFWKWQSLSFQTVCVTYRSDKNYGFYRPKCIIFSLRTACFGL